MRKISLNYLPVPPWLEVATFEVGSRLDVRPLFCALLGAPGPVRELICALVGVEADVRGDPLDVDGDGEVAEEEEELECERGMSARFPTFGENPDEKLAVGVYRELVAGERVGADASRCAMPRTTALRGC